MIGAEKMIKKNSLITIVCVMLALIVTGCGKPETYGKLTPGLNVTEIKNILMRPDSYSSETITIEGKIVSECPTGCWFNLKEGGAVIYVDLTPSAIAIPQKVGQTAVVEGEVVIKDGKPEIIGKGIRIK